MVERGDHTRFAPEALLESPIGGKLGPNQLQRNGPAEVRLVRSIHLSHPAAADQSISS